MRTAMLILSFVALLAAGCAPAAQPSQGTSAGPGAQVSSNGPRIPDAKTCAAQGGTVRPVCLMGNLACVITYADGGKTCTDKDDCLGQCRFEGKPLPPGATAKGVCQRNSDPCGCYSEVIKGKVQPGLCVD